ncbi:PREDICTED: uncharacterized protein LOC106916253 [Poecilia mexicana]|uniref:uncharacterized protein LOC106916253 n=1 Tax=Poecilia mexicana TaxID=48701 RepID=UPI00072ED75C|nr:PREDICTED: uncharacterized protein LOC106916253 [Poecilia mexicana]
MNQLHVALVICFGVTLWSHFSISTSEVQMTARPGENILLYCDCKQSSGVYIVWYKNSSHEDTPTLVLNIKTDLETEKKFPHFKFLKNFTFNSYDLLIVQANNADEGLYYCGTEESKVEQYKNKTMVQKTIYQYGNITTKITLDQTVCNSNITQTVEGCAACWKMLFSLCPALSVLFALISGVTVYLFYKKAAKKAQENNRKLETRRQIRETQDENVCYAALEIHRPSQRPKRKRKTQASDFSTYSDLKTSAV